MALSVLLALITLASCSPMDDWFQSNNANNPGTCVLPSGASTLNWIFFLATANISRVNTTLNIIPGDSVAWVNYNKVPSSQSFVVSQVGTNTTKTITPYISSALSESASSFNIQFLQELTLAFTTIDVAAGQLYTTYVVSQATNKSTVIHPTTPWVDYRKMYVGDTFVLLNSNTSSVTVSSVATAAYNGTNYTRCSTCGWTTRTINAGANFTRVWDTAGVRIITITAASVTTILDIQYSPYRVPALDIFPAPNITPTPAVSPTPVPSPTPLDSLYDPIPWPISVFAIILPMIIFYCVVPCVCICYRNRARTR